MDQDVGDRFQEEEDEYDQGNLRSYSLARDNMRRKIKIPTRYSHVEIASFALNIAEETENTEPQSYKEAVVRVNRSKWLKAMKEEMDSLEKNKTWELVDKPDQ